MAVLIDSNAILNVVTRDPVWCAWSDAQLSIHQVRGLLVNPIIYSELCVGARDISEVDQLLVALKLQLQELSRAALFRAAHAFGEYRRRGGTKTAPLPDFYIGAHAEDSNLPLITRDRGRYQTYFPGVRLICP